MFDKRKLELLNDNGDMLRAHEVVDGTLEVAKAMAKDCMGAPKSDCKDAREVIKGVINE